MIGWDKIAFYTKDLVFPLFAMILTAFAVWVAYRRNLFKMRVDLERIQDPAKPGEPRLPTGDQLAPEQRGEEEGFVAAATWIDDRKFNEYHRQSLLQASISFWFSLLFASVGFVIIGTSIFVYDDKAGYIGIVGGTIIDAVSALFFYQSNKARQLMSEFFDRLRTDRKVRESLRLTESINDDAMRDSLKVTLSLYFAGFESVDGLAKEVISAGRGNANAEQVAEPAETAIRDENEEEIGNTQREGAA